METRLRVGTRAVAVSLDSTDDGFRATVDGVARRVAVLGAGARAAASGGATVEDLALEVDGQVCRALVARRPDRVLVAIRGRVYAFDVGDEGAGAHHGGAGSGAVTAPMPGKVIAVLVGVGDEVAAGAPVVVLEAMKMETTLAAEVAGRVTAVAAVPGATVDAGALLVEIAPAA
jgi:acetyl/propionyl-CoA carboxylase alpha subunit